MTRAELKSAAKEQIKGNIGKYFLCYLIVMIGYFLLVNLPIQAVTKKMTRDILLGRSVSFLPFIFIIIFGFIIAAPIQLSFVKLELGMTKNENIKVSGLIEGYKRTGACIALTLLIQIFVMLWSLLLLIPGIIKSLSYSMAFYILADNPQMSAMEALNESKEIMKGHKWEFFVLNLSFILWILLGAITFGLAFIYVMPYMRATTANFYNSIKVKTTDNFIENEF